MIPLNAVHLTKIPTTGASTSKTPSLQPTDAARKLTKEMEDMSIQTEEIKRIQGQVKSLQEQKKRVKLHT